MFLILATKELMSSFKEQSVEDGISTSHCFLYLHIPVVNKSLSFSLELLGVIKQVATMQDLKHLSWHIISGKPLK